MHDIAVIQGILDKVVEQAPEKPTEITLKIGIGALKFVDEGNARFWLEEMLKKKYGQSLKVSITLEKIMPEIECCCGFSGKVKDFSATHDMAHLGLYEMPCPKCKAKDYRLVKGKQCLITEMKIK